MPEKELKLKVAEAIQDDVNKGIVRIDSGYLSEVDIKPGDIVEIEGERKTVAIADRSYPGSEYHKDGRHNKKKFKDRHWRSGKSKEGLG